MGRLLILHYHLNPGGVTRIIESQVQALAGIAPETDIRVITGHYSNSDFFQDRGISLIINEKLNYLDPEADFKAEYSSLMRFFGEMIMPGDILHIHNLNLGKNPVLTCVINEWVLQGYPVINHAHDFAEDRPENFEFLRRVSHELTGRPITEMLYPAQPNFFHAVLNTHDFDRLLVYGVDPSRVVLLPNPVVFDEPDKAEDPVLLRKRICAQLQIPENKKLISYPVRVIRRKNIGEYILLCWLFREEASWVVTQPPKNPVEMEFYLQWKNFCRDEDIPVIFEAGDKVDFEGLLRASDFCFSTSIREGFGMVFMEPWLMNTPVIGRDLPNITRDLEQSGMKFPLLYKALYILKEGRRIDFGNLTLQEQMERIREIKCNKHIEKELFENNPFLKNLLNSVAHTMIEQNKSTIIKEYSLNNYGQRLKSLYQKLTG